MLGLAVFLTAVNSGFIDMGRIIGMELAKMSRWVLVVVAFLMGLIVVLVEPAVHVRNCPFNAKGNYPGG